MCGIAGYAGTRRVSDAAADACAAAMHSRGPDAGGIRRFAVGRDREVCLINRRLRIIDFDPRAHQPFEYHGHWLTYNGELYNYVELKSELERRGAAFRTESDTEVLAAALHGGGVAALDRCEGMWAFAVFDAHDGSLTLSRDRFGEKPLYLYRDGTGIYFASETRALQALIGRRLAPNIAQVTRYLVNGYKSLYKSGETFFEGVTELPPGSWLRIDADGSETAGRYWNPRAQIDECLDYGTAVDGVRRRLEQAVAIRLRADVPLAFCLSGGIDSTAIAAVASRVCNYDVHGFTVVDRDPRYDERELATVAAKALGIRHTVLEVSPSDFLEDLRTQVRYHDAPVATISYFIHWRLQQSIAAAGYRVSVSGTGADELFTGYYDHHLFYLAAIRERGPRYAEAAAEWEAHVKPLVRNPLLREATRFVREPDARDHIYLDAAAFAGRLCRPWREPFVEEHYPGTDPLRNRMLNELFAESVPVILHEDDLNAMFYSIENRSPFLDRELFEFCSRIPTRHLIQRGYAKAVLRDATRDLLPASIVDNRRKIGFNASIHSLLDTSAPGVRDALLADSPIFDLVDREQIRPLLERRNLPNSESKFLFSFINARLFLEQSAA
jgi:asparagine synthase (glutamine-hydrolysing)